MGLRFLATHQDDETTLDRISTGICYVVEQDGALVGTITLYLPDGKGGTPWYDRSDVARFGQFAIEPKLQKQGIGAKLMDVIEEETANRNIPELALDTAEPATHLIRYYEKRGYRFIEHTPWDVVNYRSVIMSKTLR